jgi:hypothetical protein
MSCITGLPSCGGSSDSTRVYNEKPAGLFDCINLVFTTSQIFLPDTIIVRLDGVALDPTQYVLGVDNQTITLNVDASNPKALNIAPDNEECLRVDYDVISSASSGGCITFL